MTFQWQTIYGSTVGLAMSDLYTSGIIKLVALDACLACVGEADARWRSFQIYIELASHLDIALCGRHLSLKESLVIRVGSYLQCRTCGYRQLS